jgi:2-polyprenyl-6-methoxyphenol hydroxylase-like FAD-dependent oxidoreductase
MLKLARDAGARLLQPARCEGIAPPNARVRDLASNEVSAVKTSHILLCDGKGPSKSNGGFGLKAHFVNVDAPRDAIALYGVKGHYVGVAPIEGSRWNLAMSVPARRIARFRGAHDALFELLQAENVSLARAFARASRLGPWMASPLPRFAVESDWPDGIIPIGNAACAIEPIGGEGIGLAMRSAEIVSSEVIASRKECRPVDLRLIRASYRHLWKRRAFGCRAAALAVSRPLLAHAAAPIFRQTPALHQLALHLTGKLG